MSLRLKTNLAADFDRIHEVSLKVLAETGVVMPKDDVLDLFAAQGAKVDGHRVYIPAKMVEKALETVPRQFTWYARNPEHSAVVGDPDVFLVQPDVGPVYIQDMDGGRRLATLEDYANVIKICQASGSVHLNGTIPVDPGDVPSKEKHLHMMNAVLNHTDKPIIGFCQDGHQVVDNLKMIEIALGKKLEDECWAGVLVNPLSPLGFASETVETMVEYARRNQVSMFAPCLMAGISAPITLLGAAVLQNVELLAGLCLTQVVRPGSPFVWATASTTGYMRTGSFAAGSPEAMLINLPNLEMGQDYYKIPTRTMCGITHGKALDMQSGYETGMSLLMGVLSGAHIGVQCFGTLEAIMTISYEKMILDAEIIDRALAIKRGCVDTGRESAEIIDQAAEVISQLGPGGSFLTHPSTFSSFRQRWMPSISDWESYDVWHASANQDLARKANKKYKAILAEAAPSLLEQSVADELRAFVEKACGK